MGHYLLGLSFTAESTKKLISRPIDRRAKTAKAVKAVGGKLHQYFYSFGRYDAIAIVEYAGNVDAVAGSMMAGATGSFSRIETYPLLTIEEGVEAMDRASKGYKKTTTHNPLVYGTAP
jgi:uncharacterized protein with GYD domain